MKTSIFMCLLLWYGTPINADNDPIYPQCQYVDPTSHYPDYSKAPIRIPLICQDGYTLSFPSYHPEYVMNILQNNEIVHTSIIPEEIYQFELPHSLMGECTIELIQEYYYCFHYTLFLTNY